MSEYANGSYAWVLSLLFAAWAVSSWALAFAIRSQLKTGTGKLGLALLVAAGLGQGMASVCDINHPLHNAAGILGVFSLPVSAMLISVTLARTSRWSPAKRALLWTANATWIVLLLMMAALFAMIVGRAHHRTIAVVGYANRLLVVLDCVWTMTVAWQTIRTHNQSLEPVSAVT